MTPQSTPRSLGFRFPAEWERQAAVWFAWPVRRTLWPECFDRVRQQLAALYVLAARFQTVRVLCAESEQSALRARMAEAGDASRVELFDYQSDDVWIRDFGPLFLLHDLRGELAIADWRYNAWGDKFPDQAKDNAASQWIAEQLGLRRFAFEQVLEGGAIESNGTGALLTTEVVLLNPNRNGPATVDAVERQLSCGLCVDTVLWLKDGLVGDDTDGHIDNLARFFKPDGILLAAARCGTDPNSMAIEENRHRLERLRTPAGTPFEIIALPLPEPIFEGGEPLAASYLNFIVLNGAVLVPTYGQPENDRKALRILGNCFPGREVVGVDCRDIIKEGGALHCMSQHQPAPGFLK
jgi:agmatine deiminase